MPGLWILIAVVLLMPLLLGLPLLFRPKSRVPDYLGFALLGAALLYFAWRFEAWWMLLPAAATVAFVIWLDRKEPVAAAPLHDERGWSDRTRLRMRLWLSAHFVGWALIAGIVIMVATGARLISVTLLVEVLLLSVFASFTFRFSFCNAAERDRPVHAGAGDGSGDSPAAPASPAGFG